MKMTRKFFPKNKLYPQHFLLFRNPYLDNQANEICEEAFSVSPECFNNERKYFNFILRYCLPFEREKFHELKRLQEEAKNHIRFKDEYRGFIVMDITEWQGHMEEELFSEVTMSFLSDMSEYWKYIFVIEKKEFVDDDLKIIQRFLNVKSLCEERYSIKNAYSCFYSSMLENHGKKFNPQASKIFCRYIPDDVILQEKNRVIIGKDLEDYFPKHLVINDADLLEYFSDQDSYCFPFICEKNRIEIKERRSEKDHEKL